MLHFVSDERIITGIDYDCEKIDVATNCPSKNEKIKFECADITSYQFEDADVFLLSDVLHYLPKEEQQMRRRSSAKVMAVIPASERP